MSKTERNTESASSSSASANHLLSAAVELCAPEFVVHAAVTAADQPYATFSDAAFVRGGPAPAVAARGAHRFLDLRSAPLQRALRLRSDALFEARAGLRRHGFVEVETPTLFRTTPEGAREFLVPARAPGRFYALPQSPQQYKQLLMVAGIERYFQLARCYRDEDLRADRQPEFTQLDLEMSFAGAVDVQNVVEDVVRSLFRLRGTALLPGPLPRMSFDEVLGRFGIDKPDMRFGLELCDASRVFDARTTLAGPIAAALRAADADSSPERPRARPAVIVLNVRGLADASRSELDGLHSAAEAVLGRRGTAEVRVRDGRWTGPLRLSDAERAGLSAATDARDGDLLVLCAGPWLQACEAMGRVRLAAAAQLRARGRLAAADPDEFRALWVTDFPLFSEEPDATAPGGRRIVTTHHPFTAPHPDDVDRLADAPLSVRGMHYDLVVNGWEVGGGSVRCHNEPLQRLLFRRLGVAEAPFRHLLAALRMGAPPHAGLALGFDRLIAILTGADSLRDVIAFPKTNTGQEVMSDSPSQVTPDRLRELAAHLDPGNWELK